MNYNREVIFDVISGERNYQDSKWIKPLHIHNTTEYLVYIDHYVKKAMEKVSTVDDPAGLSALDEIRKIAALAVACMEENGFIERQ